MIMYTPVIALPSALAPIHYQPRRKFGGMMSVFVPGPAMQRLAGSASEERRDNGRTGLGLPGGGEEEGDAARQHGGRNHEIDDSAATSLAFLRSRIASACPWLGAHKMSENSILVVFARGCWLYTGRSKAELGRVRCSWTKGGIKGRKRARVVVGCGYAADVGSWIFWGGT